MTDDVTTVRTDFDNIDPAEHVVPSAASFRAVKAMDDALGRSADNMQDYFHQDARWRGNVGCGTKEGLAEFRRNGQPPLRATFADRTYTTERFLADRDREACFGAIEATHVGPFMGIPATGRRVRLPSMDFRGVEESRIKENPGFVDLAAVCLQLGRDVFDGEGRDAFDRGEKEPPHP